jgi:homoserine acetyltransferase
MDRQEASTKAAAIAAGRRPAAYQATHLVVMRWVMAADHRRHQGNYPNGQFLLDL